MRRFATWMAVLVLVGIGAGAPGSMHAQPATPEQIPQEMCPFISQGNVTEILLGQVPSGSNGEVLRLTSFSFTGTDLITVKDCEATEVYHIDEGPIVFTFSKVESGVVVQAGVQGCEPPTGCKVEPGKPYTLQTGDSVGHTGPAGYTLQGEAGIKSGDGQAPSGLDQGSGDPRGTRGCNGRC